MPSSTNIIIESVAHLVYRKTFANEMSSICYGSTCVKKLGSKRR